MILEALALPSHLHTQHKISKKSLVAQTQNSASTQRLLQQTLSNSNLLAHITPNSSNIPAYQDEQSEYLELMVIQCTLKDKLPSHSQCSQLHRLFHQHIPYPVILEIITANGESAQWSLAHKTINQADTSNEKLVVQEIIQTHWLPLTTPDTLLENLFAAIEFNQQPKQHLLALYEALQQYLVSYLLALSLNKTSLKDAAPAYAVSLDEKRDTLHKIQQLKQDIAALENKRNKTQQFNEKVELNMEIQKLKAQLAKLA